MTTTSNVSDQSSASDDDDASTPHRGATLLEKLRMRSAGSPVLRVVVILAVFTLAFTLRVAHNAGLEHRVWFLEDAQNYLRSGNSIREMVKSSKSPVQLLENISADAKTYSGMYEAFDSDKLVDRMMTDGPIFPAYLAAVETACGLDLQPFQFRYERIAFKISVANAFVDSATCALVCALGFLLFGTLPGALGGLLYAVYPAAIVNTQWCMSETFCTFMLTASVYCLARLLTFPRTATLGRLLLGTASGITLGLTVLSRSAFPLLLPFLILPTVTGLAVLRNNPTGSTEPAASSNSSGKSKLTIAGALLALALAFCITIAPWLWYTNTAMGQPRLTTNRLPAFNVISGNLSTIDGWTPYPNKLAFPEDMRSAVAMVIDDAKNNPADFALLQMKKVGRLWSSVWNDCKYAILGLSPAAQNVFHQLMLFLAAGWAFIACTKGRRGLTERELFGSVVIASIVGYHGIYIAFIALSRYAFSAMPFVILAAGASASYWITSGKLERMRFLFIAASFCAIAALTNEFKSISSSLVALLPPNESWLLLTPCLLAATASVLVGGALVVLWRSTNQSLGGKKKPALLALSACILSIAATTCGITGSIFGSHTWSEWECKLNHDDSVTQTISLPANLGKLGPTSFIVMDIHSEDALPEVKVSINTVDLKEPAIPLAMIQKDNEAIVKSLAVQSKVMDMDYRALRHWYLVPFPSSLLKLGGNNVVEVQNASPGTATITVYGDYCIPSTTTGDGVQTLPSINSMSWNYAVEGNDYRVPIEQRLLEKIDIKGKTVSSTLHSSRISSTDLSPSPGRQWGKFRIRLLLKPLTETQIAKHAMTAKATSETASLPASPHESTILAQEPNQVRTVHGGDPTTFYLTPTDVSVSEDLLGRHPIKFTCELKTEKRKANAFANLVFKTGNGDIWTPTWQPDSIPVDSKTWKKITIIDYFPANLLQHGGITTRPVITPFCDDLVFQQNKKASKQSVQIRNAKLEFLPTEIPPRRDLFSWKVY